MLNSKSSNGLLWSFLLLAVGAILAYGRATVNIPASHPIYEILDRLESYGCLQPSFRLFRPQSYGELRRSILVPKDTTCAAPKWLIEETNLFRSHSLPSEAALTAYVWRNDRVPLRGLEASITPSFPFLEGRPLFDGPNLYTEASLHGSGGGDIGFAFSATPGFMLGLKEYKQLNGRAYFHRGYLKVGIRQIELLFGRSLQRFGEFKHGSLLLSSSAKPLNLLKFSVRPHQLGGPFGVLGLFTFETWVSLGSRSSFVEGSKFWAIQIGMQPFTGFEFGILQLYQFGGSGIPSLGFGDVAKMLVAVGGDDLNAKRQRNLGLHFSVWGPSRYLKWYTQFLFSDLGPMRDWFTNDISFQTGIWFPRLGTGELRLEYARTVPSAYQHSLWPQGLTYFGHTLGHPLGPDAEGIYIDAGLPAIDRWRPLISFSYEARDKSPNPGLATEWRWSGGLGVQKRWKRTRLSVYGKYASVSNHANIIDRDEDFFSFLAGLTYTLY